MARKRNRPRAGKALRRKTSDAAPGTRIDRAKRDAAKTGRAAIRFGIVVVAAGLLALLWPQISVLFSPARSVVDVVRADSVYVEPGDVESGGPAVDPDLLRSTIGTRPIVVLVVNEDGDLDSERADVCSDVADYFDVLVIVIVDGEWQRGCQSDDVGLGSLDIDQLDIKLWLVAFPRLTQFLDGDPQAQVEQLALLYDRLVRDGDLVEQTRSFEAGPSRYALASVMAVAVIAAGIGGHLLLRRLAAIQLRRSLARSGWANKRRELDLELTEIGLLMIDATPAQPISAQVSTHSAGPNRFGVAALAPDYLQALNDLEAVESGSDLTDLTARIQGLRRRAESQKART